MLLVFLSAKHFTSEMYQLRKSKQKERPNMMIIGSLRPYVAKHQQDWNINVQFLTYRKRCQVHRSTNLTRSSVNASRSLTCETTLYAQTDLKIDKTVEKFPYTWQAGLQHWIAKV